MEFCIFNNDNTRMYKFVFNYWKLVKLVERSTASGCYYKWHVVINDHIDMVEIGHGLVLLDEM
jgi:hypothetical protein